MKVKRQKVVKLTKIKIMSQKLHKIKRCKMCHQSIKQGRSDKKIYLWNVCEFHFSLVIQ